MRLPDFFIIGAMKAATSTLHEQLAAQPGLHMSEPKELYFFSDDHVWDNGLEWYANHFADASASDLCGESSTHYAKLPTYPNTIDRLAANLREPRFIYVMRQPVDRLVSQYQHQLLDREITMSFDDALDGGLPELLQYSRYAMQLRPFLNRFGPESVLPVFFDHLLTNPQAELERVCSFVGYERAPRWQADIASNITSERLRVSPVRERLRSIPFVERLRGFVPDAAVERHRRRRRPEPTSPMSTQQLQRVEGILNPDLAELGSWLDTPLTCSNFRDATTSSPLQWSASVPARITHS